MPSFVSQLLPVLVLVSLGVILGRRGVLTDAVTDGLKRLVAGVTLPVLLFGAFSRMRLEPSQFILAAIVFACCGIMGLLGRAITGFLKLPLPSTVHLFQGFEAGMLGYALFASFFGADKIAAFATADLGQVLFVFTILMAQLTAPAGRHGAGKHSAAKRDAGKQSAGAPRLDLKSMLLRMAGSPVIIAIALGLASSAFAPEAAGMPWAPDGVLADTISAVGSLTTPLVCLVVGFGLSGSLEGIGRGAVTVIARIIPAGALGVAVALYVVPALGLAPIVGIAVLVLFIMPPPFVIPVFRKHSGDASYVSSVLSLHTLVSLAATVAIAAFSGGLAP